MLTIGLDNRSYCATNKMSSNLSGLLLPILLTIGCVALLINIRNVKHMNRSLVENVDKVQADLRVAMDTSQECSKQMVTVCQPGYHSPGYGYSKGW